MRVGCSTYYAHCVSQLQHSLLCSETLAGPLTCLPVKAKSSCLCGRAELNHLNGLFICPLLQIQLQQAKLEKNEAPLVRAVVLTLCCVYMHDMLANQSSENARTSDPCANTQLCWEPFSCCCGRSSCHLLCPVYWVNHL